jgi:hypothetical protein
VLQRRLAIFAVQVRNLGKGRIGTAVSLRDIPNKYKHLPIIGRGATSIILDEGNGKVIILTRDSMKQQYLTNALDGKWLDAYSASHANPDISEMPIHIIEMPKLDKLSKVNYKKVQQLIRQTSADWLASFGKSGLAGEQHRRKLLQDWSSEDNEDHPLHHIGRHLVNYSDMLYHWDLNPHNFMQDKAGNIIAADPIVDTYLLKALRHQKPVGRQW